MFFYDFLVVSVLYHAILVLYIYSEKRMKNEKDGNEGFGIGCNDGW